MFQIQDPSQAKVFDTVIFEGPPVTEQKLWPAHAVQDTWGAELHKDLKVINGTVHLRNCEQLFEYLH